uniref:ZZ-type domain-containing protein n=1 Tax=Globisporangium ultimum (strain ATCC 200006 / CBS 805.95 / DAOM BR144) TaxID=431595 RepID=K3WQ87_GLOUD
MALFKTRASVNCVEIEQHAQLLLLQREEQFYQQSPTDATAMIMDDYEMVENENEEDADETILLLSPAVAPSTVHTLPQEMLQHVLRFLDGGSLLACALVCRAMTPLTYDRDVWKNICMQQWPTLQTQFLPQLPGAPDYDLIRLYGGCWRRCFVEQHQFNARAELRVQIPQFPALAATTDVDKIVSETFSIGEHRFCLWIFPNGNPNEPQYAGKVLSVYLVLTDLERRAPSWLTCAVFSLSVVNHVDPSKRIEWHSCLVDNKFDHQLNNWGVHSLGALKNLTNPENGFLQHDNTLTVTAKVRLMSITFRVVREHDMKRHHHLGLTDLARVDTIELPFCCTLQDLLKALHTKYDIESDQVNVWCFNQPVVSGQALRPRKLLTHASVDPRQPMFSNLLCDGVDIDAYSFCQIYVESKVDDDAPLECATIATLYSSEDGISSAMDMETDSTVPCANGHDRGYLFVKIMDPRTQQLEYLGRINFAAHLTASMIYECVAKHVGCASSELLMFKEEIAPTVVSGPIVSSDKPVMTAQSGHACDDSLLHPTDIVIFTLRDHCAQNAFVATMENLLWTQYAHAESLVQDSFAVPTLEQIETLAEKLDIPKFRVRSAFRKCNEDGRRTLKYIMEGRHLGFICDSCGETDFKGPRFNCSLCADYDLCRACNAQCQEVNHRYANRDGKWQRVYDFKEHKMAHQMREMMPVFYQYRPDKNGRLHDPEDAIFMAIQ